MSPARFQLGRNFSHTCGSLKIELKGTNKEEREKEREGEAVRKSIVKRGRKREVNGKKATGRNGINEVREGALNERKERKLMAQIANTGEYAATY